jgi:hypothetical protein
MKRCFKRGHVLAFLVCVAHSACGGGGSNQTPGTGGMGGGQAPGAPPGTPGAPAAGAGGGQVAAGGAGGAPGAPGMGGRGGGAPRGDAGGQPNTDGGGSMPVPADVAAACTTYAGAICAKMMACSPAELQADFGDMATCASRKALTCTSGAGAPGGMVNAQVLMGCVAELGAAACDAFATRGVASCLIKGRRGDGDACASDFQCGSGFCKRTRGVNCGSCTPLGRPMSPCAESIECGPNLECSDAGACVVPSAVGGPCSAAQACKYGTYCAGNNTCAAQGEMAGAACMGRDACSGQKGLVCSNNRCAAIVFAKPGQACGGQGVLLCEASADCVLGQQGNMGTCSMVAKDGESCAMGKSCLAPAECLSGLCDIPRGTDTGFCN